MAELDIININGSLYNFKDASAYHKPNDGIPSSDLTSAIQALLTKASTALQPQDLTTLNSDVASLKALIESDSDNVIDKFNEIVTFLNGISASSSLDGIISDISSQISAKYTKPASGIPMSDLSNEVQQAINSGGSSPTITMDDTPTSGSSNPVKSSGIYNALQGKQNTLTFDSTPTASSSNPVTSGGVKAALDLKANQSTTYSKTEVDALFDDAETDSLWKKAQTLSIDEQDIVSANLFNKASGNGMGRVVLKKNQSFASQVTQANTIYVIKYDYTLTSDVTMPANCVLQFDGGSISGSYTLTGNNTCINAELVKIFGTDTTLAGSWNVTEAYPEWFGAKGDGVTNDTGSINSAVNVGNTLVVNQGTYMIDATLGVSLKSYFTMKLLPGAILKAIPNSANTYKIINSDGCTDVVIEGGKIVGDRYNHTGTDGEHGMGIELLDSSNIIIRDIEIYETWGDAIYIGTSSVNTGGKCQNILISHCKLHDCRRQGISVVHCDGFRCVDSEIYNINGTNPQSGIDLEVNYPAYPNSNCFVERCNFHNTTGPNIIIGNPINNFMLTDCVLDGDFESQRYSKNLLIKGCKILGKTLVGNESDANEELHISASEISWLSQYNKGVLFVDNCIIRHIEYAINTGVSEDMATHFYDCFITNPNAENDVSDVQDSILNHRIFSSNVRPKSVSLKNCEIVVRSVAGSTLGVKNNIVVSNCIFKANFTGTINWNGSHGFFDLTCPTIIIKDCLFELSGLPSYGAYGLFRPDSTNLSIKNVSFNTNSALGTYAIRNGTANATVEVIGCDMRKYNSDGLFSDTSTVFKKYNIISTTVSD